MNASLLLSVLTLGAILPYGYAQSPAQVADQAPAQVSQVAMKPTKVALFKNGFGFFSFEGKMPNAPRMEMTNLPIPSFGTFWMDASSPSEVVKLTAAPVKTKIKVDSGDFYEIAQANIGKEVSILRSGQGEKIIDEGVIVSVSSETKSGNPNLIGSIEEHDDSGRRMIVISTELEPNQFEYSYIPVNDIMTMVFVGTAPANKAEREVEKTALYVDVADHIPGGTLSASCLVKGISWVPEYKMELDDSGKAWFQAQALVMNDLMDMEHVDMSFVSGFPSLKFANVESPLAGRYKTLDDFLRSLDEGKGGGNSNRQRRVFTNAFSLQGNGIATGGIRSDDSSPSSPNEVVQAEDLFFYPVKDFSCKYGETVLVPLFGGEVPYKHLYIWDIPEQRQLIEWDRQFESGNPSPQDASRDIWHCVRFTNKFSVPLTTGALEFTSRGNGNIAGQGVVNFTSPGQEATVRVNKTMQVTTTREEKTVTTERQEVKRTNASSGFYSVSTIEGVLTMKNYSDKPMLMEVTKRVLGTPVSASGGGTFSSVPGWNAMNPSGKFKWTVEVQPGETKTLTYRYSFVE